jgi:hypothetical protein
MTTPTSKVLVYQHRHNAANPIVNDGLAVMTTSELDNILETRKCPRPQEQTLDRRKPMLTSFIADPNLQRTSKPIPRGALSIDVYERDLLTEAQKPQFAAMPNYETNVAGVTVPLKIFLGKLLGSKEFEELVILSAKR